MEKLAGSEGVEFCQAQQSSRRSRPSASVSAEKFISNIPEAELGCAREVSSSSARATRALAFNSIARFLLKLLNLLKLLVDLNA